MSVRKGIYHVLEHLIKASHKPLTSVEVHDHPEVREIVGTGQEGVDKVSDYLGHMYRRNLLARVPSRGIGMAKWAYYWRDPKVGSAAVPVQRVAQPRLVVRKFEDGAAANHVAEMAELQKNNGVVFEKPSVKISEEGRNIVIDLPRLRITIAAK